MSLKENVQAIKEEISAEEQFLESAIRGERFLKKYKKPLIAIVSLIIIISVAYSLYNYMKERNFTLANEAYLTLQKNPNDKDALSLLKEKSPNLYTAFLFHEAIKKNDIAAFEKVITALKDPNLKDIAMYQIASLKRDKNALDSYAQTPNAVLKDLAFLEEGYLLIKEGKVNEGKTILSQISLSSPLQSLVQALNHYGVTLANVKQQIPQKSKDAVEWKIK